MKNVIKFKDRTLLKAEQLEVDGREIYDKMINLLLPDKGVDTPKEVLYFILKSTALASYLIENLGEVAKCPEFNKAEKEHFIYQVNGCLDKIGEVLQEARVTNNDKEETK